MIFFPPRLEHLVAVGGDFHPERLQLLRQRVGEGQLDHDLQPAVPQQRLHRDDGGGTTLVFPATPTQSSVLCSISTASSSEKLLYAQMVITVDFTVAFLASAFTTAPVRGAKLVAADTSQVLHVRGIRAGRGYGLVEDRGIRPPGRRGRYGAKVAALVVGVAPRGGG